VEQGGRDDDVADRTEPHDEDAMAHHPGW
jgi:hypothetical protein